MPSVRHSWHARTDDLGDGRKLFVTQRGMNADCYLYGGTTEQTDPDTGEKFTHASRLDDGSFTRHPCDIRMNRFRKPLVLKHGGKIVTMRPLDVAGNPAGVKSIDRISYPQVWAGVDCIRKVTPEGVKSDYRITAAPPSEIGFAIVGDVESFLAWHREPYIVRPGVFDPIPVPWSFDGSTLVYDLSGAQVGDVVDPTLALQPDASAGKDCFFTQSSPTTNGSDTTLRVGALTWNTVYGYRSLIEFSLASIAAGATITSASMELYEYNAGGNLTAPWQVECHKVLRSDWVENQATWNIYKTGSNWGTAGCNNTTTDRNAANSATVSLDGTAGNAFVAFSGSGMVADTQAQIGSTVTWLVKSAAAEAGTASYKNAYNYFYSSDYTTDTAKRPKLTVEYTEGSTGGIVPILYGHTSNLLMGGF